MDAFPWRASGFYISPNHLAGLLEVMAVMALALSSGAHGGSGQEYFWLPCVACLFAVAVTGSRVVI